MIAGVSFALAGGAVGFGIHYKRVRDARDHFRADKGLLCASVLPDLIRLNLKRVNDEFVTRPVPIAELLAIIGYCRDGEDLDWYAGILDDTMKADLDGDTRGASMGLNAVLERLQGRDVFGRPLGGRHRGTRDSP